MPDYMLVLDRLQGVCTRYCLEFWGVLGAWLSGIGTVAAVLVSLHLARQDQRIRLGVSAVVGLMIGDPFTPHTVDHLWIQVPCLEGPFRLHR